MNQNQYLNGKTLLLGILGILLLGLSGCTSKTPSLKGSWEMFVGQDPSLIGQEYGADNVTYCMELNFSERTFSADNLPDGRNSYGWMDFSTMNRVYHYEIDSVSYIGKNQYRVVSVDSWLEQNVDTLTYNPKTKEITYNSDWKFKLKDDGTAVSGEPSSLLSGVGPWILILAVLLVVSLISLNVLDIEGVIRFWLPASGLLVMSVLILSLVYDVFYNGGNFDIGGKGAMDVLKLYGSVVLITASFLFGLFSIMLYLYEEFGRFSKLPTILSAVVAVVLLVIQIFTGNLLFDILIDHFWSSLTYQTGLFEFIMALLVVAVGVLFIIQMIILAVSLKGIYRIAILLMYPVFFAAGVVLLISSMAVMIVVVIVCLVVVFGLSFLKASFNSVATYTPNITPNADTNANADMDADTNEEDYDAILKGAGTLGDDVKAKDISALGNGSLLRGENGVKYERGDDGNYRRID